jgi:Arc/MetJ-type ribon-helix-helix transcriptional regulator
MKMNKRKLKFWNIPVTAHLDRCVERAVQEGSFVSKSDFVREAVREKLAKVGRSDLNELEEEIDLAALERQVAQVMEQEAKKQ